MTRFGTTVVGFLLFFALMGISHAQTPPLMTYELTIKCDSFPSSVQSVTIHADAIGAVWGWDFEILDPDDYDQYYHNSVSSTITINPAYIQRAYHAAA